MAIKALNPFAPVWYTPPGQDDEGAISEFQLIGLNGIQQAELQPEISVEGDAGDDVVISPRGMALLLRYGLVDWKNFEDDSGPVIFGSWDANQRRMPLPLQSELAAQIFTLTFTPEETKKK